MKAYLLILELEPLKPQATYAMLPLHCTTVHWFWLNEACLPELESALRTIAMNTAPPLLTAEHEETFTGVTKEGTVPVTVNKIKRTDELKSLHDHLCATLDRLGADYSMPQYVKAGFTPHVTHQGDSRLEVGKSRPSPTLTLATAAAPEYGNDRHIVGRFTLTGS